MENAGGCGLGLKVVEGGHYDEMGRKTCNLRRPGKAVASGR